MKDRSLNFRVVKAILALPVTVCVLIPAILLYLSGWQRGDGCLWRLLVGAICLLAGLTLAYQLDLFPFVGGAWAACTLRKGV